MTTSRRTKKAWQKIFEDQRASGHSIKAYCLEHKICTSSFYSQKKKQTSQDSPFIQAKISPTLLVKQQYQPITLTYKNTTLTLSESTSPQFVADILRYLA